MTSTLPGSPGPLAESFDVAMLDLDGVVYVGPDAVPGVPAALASARAAGMRLAFVTNNAARPPTVVAQHLTELGIAATADEVVTSAQAAARYLADRLAPGARVLVVGTVGLEQALRERGLVPVVDAAGEVDAVVQGYSPELNWRLLAEGAVAINRGVPWVATNADPTVPSPRGPLPGNGSMVAALRHATGVVPVVTGKPDPAMHRETLLRTGAERPIVVGDRLDTDIEGANAVGCASLAVLSGVTDARDLLAAAPHLRPTYLAYDVAGLLERHAAASADARGGHCGSWRVRPVDSGWELSTTSGVASVGGGSSAPDVGGRVDLDALRALCAAAWWSADSQDGTRPHNAVTGADDRAAVVLEALGLSGG